MFKIISKIKLFFAKNKISEGKLKYLLEYLGIYIYIYIYNLWEKNPQNVLIKWQKCVIVAKVAWYIDTRHTFSDKFWQWE
jgi:hypothetical protein